MVLTLILASFIKQLRPYAIKQFYSDDQRMLAFLNGKPDHTISGHVGARAKLGKKEYKQAEKLINLLFWWDKDHCQRAIELDELSAKNRKQIFNKRQ